MRYLSKKDYSILLGNIIDHFDTSIYIFLAPMLVPIFFPHSDPEMGLIMAYGILATSIVTRPLGTYLFGALARASSPPVALSYSLIGVGVTTLLVGLLPDYDLIGKYAPILLIIFRIFGGIFAAGESAIAKLYLIQDKADKEAHSCSYLYQLSTVLGIFLASMTAALIHSIDTANAWRLCFIFGGIASIIGFYIRKTSLPAPASGLQLFKFYDASGLRELWHHRRVVVRIAIVESFSQITYVIPFVSMNYLIPLFTNISLSSMMYVNSFMLIFNIFAIIFIGRIVASFAPKYIMMRAGLMLALTIIPLWYFIEGASIAYVTFVRLWIIILGVAFLCPLNLWYRDQIAGDEKYIIVGMGTTLASGIIGKLTPSICLVLYYSTGSHMSVIFYAACIFVAALFVINE
ncbi:MAG: MFS transporter [Rickettsiales bacterium]|nr:MAG: MFS transporter [Rickettsiales bacterium]